MDALLRKLRIVCGRCNCNVPLDIICLSYWDGFWNISCDSGYCHQNAFYITFHEILENGASYIDKLETIREYKMSTNTFMKRRKQLFSMIRESISKMNDPIP